MNSVAVRARHRDLAVGDRVSFNGEGIGEHLSDLSLERDRCSYKSEACLASEAIEVAHMSVHVSLSFVKTVDVAANNDLLCESMSILAMPSVFEAYPSVCINPVDDVNSSSALPSAIES